MTDFEEEMEFGSGSSLSAQIDRQREVFFTARPANSRTENLMPIIEGDLRTYISGDKSPQQVSDVMQNRVQLYMDEMN